MSVLDEYRMTSNKMNADLKQLPPFLLPWVQRYTKRGLQADLFIYFFEFHLRENSE